MPFSYTCTDFLRTLLENCIGTVMIEWEQWNFPSPSFDRGYFNSRLKQAMEHLNEAFSIYDKMLPENARQLLQPYSTLANLLLALNEYDESITNYSHVLWLMKENGYTEDSFAFHEFTDRINEVRQLKAQAAATE